MKTKKSLQLFMACMIAIFTMNLANAALDHGSMMKTGEALYPIYDGGTKGAAIADYTFDFKVVTINGKSWAWTNITGGNIQNSSWSSQLRYWPGKVENNLTGRIAETQQTYGVSYNSIPANYSGITFLQESGDDSSFKESDTYTYNLTAVNTPIAGDNTKPVLGTCSFSDKTENSVFLSLNATDANAFFYHIKDVANEFETISFIDTLTINGLASGTEYNLVITAIDFSGNESTTKIITFTTVEKEFDASANLALNMPATASSGNANDGNDGNDNTRWESSQEDNQWWYVKLQKDCIINQVKVLWEGAFAEIFDIQVALTLPDNPAGDEGWTTVYSKTDKNAGIKPNWDIYDFNAVPARYVKINCKKRATQYGNSFFEFQVYGTGYYTPGNTGLTSVNVTPANATIYLGDTQQFSYTAINGIGQEIENPAITWSCTPETGNISSTGAFTTSTEDTYTITCTAVKDGVTKSASTSLTVKAARIVDNLVFKFPYNAILVDEIIHFTCESYDQYGDIYSVPVNYVTNKGTVNPEEKTFVCATAGSYTITATAGDKSVPITLVVVKNNLIDKTGMTAVATSENETFPASLVIDNDGGTRWVSIASAVEPFPASDPQTLTINLGSAYYLDMLEIKWEGACAADYNIEIAETENGTYTTVGGENNVPGMNSYTYRTAIQGIKAQFIKINCETVATPYGYSIFEINTFGRINNTGMDTQIANNNFTAYYANNMLQIESMEEVNTTIYGVGGQMILNSNTKNIDLSTLNGGCYIAKITTATGNYKSLKFVK